jgi:UPF0716 protein FxsA
MFWLIVGLIILIPVLELWGLITVGHWIGPLPTILLVIASGVLGGYLMRREGMRTWRLAMIQLQNGELPGATLLDGALILAGGIFLLTPGFFTDIIGFILVLPWTRPIVRHLILRWLERKLRKGAVFVWRRKW